MPDANNTTLRLIFPQWQGGNNPPYVFGTKMLEWLAPDHTGPVERVDVALPSDGEAINEGGIIGRKALLAQLADARAKIDRHRPDRIVVLGGDCLVDLAPFSYLNERYDGDLAVLWLDTHPDVMSVDVFENAHAMVMGHLLGEGDGDFTGTVKRPIKPENVMFAGVRETGPEAPGILAMETAFFDRLNLRTAGPAELADSSAPVLDWLRETGTRHLAIHFDLDVLDPHLFRSLLFANPEAPIPAEHPKGQMTIAQVTRLLQDVAKHVDVVGLGITEHLPWDAMALRDMLSDLPLVGSPER